MAKATRSPAPAAGDCRRATWLESFWQSAPDSALRHQRWEQLSLTATRNVRKDDDVRALVDKTVARFGRLDVAVNSAGTEGQVGPITDQTAENYAATFDTNVLGVILSMKHEVRAMQGQGSGSIINISSTYGHEGAAGASIYVGSKHAVEGIQLAQPGSVASVIRNERL